MKILIAIDHSTFSQAALRWVREQRWPDDARFVLVSAAHVAVYAPVEPAGAAVYEQFQWEEEQAHEALIEKARAELAATGLSVTGKVERGDPREAILRLAEVERPDLIVVGSHGRTGLTKLLLGSVAGHVVTHAPCTVVVVRPPLNPARPGEETRS
jgi:nucleotide-binding universal stress UspA family protein